jgi:hypothetical protein
MIVLSIIRGLACIVLIICGGLIATQINALIGCLVSATGLLALLAPFIIEEDKNKQHRLQQSWEGYNGK